MLLVVSPAKNLDFESSTQSLPFSQPDFLGHAQELVDQCKTLSPADLSSLMGISDKLAGLNAARFSSWSTPFDQENAKQALFAFNGDVYAGLEADKLSEEDLDFAQQRLRILSGLYGLLKPLDLMQPYRLEMGTKLKNGRGKDLYAFWGKHITEGLNDALQHQHTEVLVNLASNEYFKSVKADALNAKIVTPVFKDEKNGQYKIISFFAKKARGMMAKYIIQNRINTPEGLKDFSSDGYRFCSDESNASTLVFKRAAQ